MKPLLRVRMELLAVRYVAADKPIEALPGQPVPLAPPKQGVPPSAANFTAEALQSSEIAWDCVIVEVALHHTVQPLTEFGDGFVPPHQSGPNGRQRRPHAFLHRKANDLEPPLTVGPTAVRESQEIERLRMALAPLATVLDGESTKLDQPRLVGVQRQSEFREPLLQVMQELPCRPRCLPSRITASASRAPDFAAQYLACQFPLSTLRRRPRGRLRMTRGQRDSPLLLCL